VTRGHVGFAVQQVTESQLRPALIPPNSGAVLKTSHALGLTAAERKECACKRYYPATMAPRHIQLWTAPQIVCTLPI